MGLISVLATQLACHKVWAALRCLLIAAQGAEDVINKSFAFEISTHTDNMFYIADTDKEKVSRANHTSLLQQ